MVSHKFVSCLGDGCFNSTAYARNYSLQVQEAAYPGQPEREWPNVLCGKWDLVSMIALSLTSLNDWKTSFPQSLVFNHNMCAGFQA